MSFQDFVPLVQSLRRIVTEARTAADAWQTIRARERAIGHAVTPLPDGDIDAEVALLAEQLRALFRDSPPPPSLKLLYFGLFPALNRKTRKESAGYYVAGSTRPIIEPVESSSELAGDALDFEPENRYLESPLLERIKAAAGANDRDYDRYDYAVMLGAACVLSLYSVRQLGMAIRVVTGFDSGDAVELQA